MPIMMRTPLRHLGGSLRRTPLRLVEGLEEDPQAYHRAYDLGHTHASRGKDPEPDNPSVPGHLKKAYMSGFATGRAETAAPGVERPEHEPADTGGQRDVKPSMTLSLDDVPESVGRVAATINAAGGRALLIGGAVRDKLMGKQSKDWDIEVYGLDTDRLADAMRVHGNVDEVGKKFGVLKLVVGDEDFDVSVPRREVKTGPGHKDYDIVPDPSMTIKEAALRRDYTMNTVSMDPHTGDMYDPYNGAQDINDRVLRATDPGVFVEDSLRILRGAQFAARFGMTVEPKTMELMQQASPELVNLPRARIGTEWRKLLMKGETPSTGLDVMKQTGALRELHPELEALETNGTWDQTKVAVDRATELTKEATPQFKEAIRYGALFHAVSAQNMAEMLHASVDIPKNTSARISQMLSEQANVHDQMTDADIRRMAHRMGPATIEELSMLTHAVRGDEGRDTAQTLLQRAQELGVSQAAPRPILQGRHLMQKGVKGGPWIGKTLAHVYDKQLNGDVTDMESAQREAQIAMTQHECRGLTMLPRREGLNLL